MIMFMFVSICFSIDSILYVNTLLCEMHVNTFIEYWYLIYTNVNSQYFSIARELN